MNSPFYIVQDFLSNKQCEELLEYYKINTPNIDQYGEPIKLEKIMTPSRGQLTIIEKLKTHIPSIEKRYNGIYEGTEQLVVSHYPENQNSKMAEAPGCENSKYLKRKWLKFKDIDLTGILWLNEYNSEVPIDTRFEVYGGKLEFPQYNFSFVPQRGTLILFPAYPQFITCVSPILIGDLYQIKINIKLSKDGGLWLYDPKHFPIQGNNYMQSWLQEYL